MSREEYIEHLTHMQIEDQKCMLGCDSAPYNENRRYNIQKKWKGQS